MTSTVATESLQRAGCFLVSEANKTRSRTQGVLAEGENCVAGTVLGKVGSGEHVALDPAGVDGENVAAGILFASVDATAAAQRCVVVDDDCEVHPGKLVWPAGITNGQKATAVDQLRALGIKMSPTY